MSGDHSVGVRWQLSVGDQPEARIGEIDGLRRGQRRARRLDVRLLRVVECMRVAASPGGRLAVVHMQFSEKFTNTV